MSMVVSGIRVQCEHKCGYTYVRMSVQVSTVCVVMCCILPGACTSSRGPRCWGAGADPSSIPASTAPVLCSRLQSALTLFLMNSCFSLGYLAESHPDRIFKLWVAA